VRFAAEYVDRAARQVIRPRLAGEERAGYRLGYAAPRLILVQGPLERPKEQVTLCSVGLDHAQAGVVVAVRCLAGFSDVRDKGHLPSENEELSARDVRLEKPGISNERSRDPDAGVEV